MGEMIRTFIAIELDHAVLKALDKLQGELKREIPGNAVRWVSSTGIHLTLKFLGDVLVEQIPLIKTGIEQASQPHDPFTVTCLGTGCFPNVQRPRVVWVGVQDLSGTLKRLQQAVEKAIAPLGYPTEAREFSPHLTLGRVQRTLSPDELQRLSNFIRDRQSRQIAAMEVHSVSLMRSDLRSTGAVYTCLANIPLGGSA
jgi:2'-5' RNA ligase